MTPAYFKDMEIVDKRLTKLEDDYTKIIQLLNEITNDLSEIKVDNPLNEIVLNKHTYI